MSEIWRRVIQVLGRRPGRETECRLSEFLEKHAAEFERPADKALDWLRSDSVDFTKWTAVRRLDRPGKEPEVLMVDMGGKTHAFELKDRDARTPDVLRWLDISNTALHTSASRSSYLVRAGKLKRIRLSTYTARTRFRAPSRLFSSRCRDEDAQRAGRILDSLSLLVPCRLAEEEIGDALERVNRLVSLGSPRWRLWLKVTTTVFWVLLNSLREITSAVRGRASAKP